MTLIENDSPKVQYTGPFVKGQLLPLTFPYIAKTDVYMLIDGVPAELNKEFEIITEVSAEHPVAYPNSVYIKNALPNAKQITIYRSTPLDQQAPFPQMSKFRSERIEQALDKLTMQQQEQEEQLSRCIIAPITLETFNGQLPAPAADQALKWNTEGTELENYDIIGEQEAFETEVNTKFEEQSTAIENRIGQFEEETNTQFSEFRNEINENLEAVLNAAAQLEKLDEAVQSTENAAAKANQSALSAQSSAQSAQDSYNNFKESVDGALSTVNNTVQGAITTIDTKSSETIESINNIKTDTITDIEVIADGEKEELLGLANEIKDNAEDIINRVGISMFDTVLKDHILTYEESKGLALQGTYVYKEAVAGSRYGYPDFYNKCLEEMGNSTQEVIGYKSGEKWEQPINPTGISSYLSFADPQNAFDGNSSTYTRVGSTEAYIEWDLGQNLSVSGFTATGLWVNGQAMGTELCIYSVDAEGNETLLGTSTGRSDSSSPYTLTCNFTPVICNKLRFKATVASTSTPPRIAEIKLIANVVENIYVYKNPNGHLFYNIADKEVFDNMFNSTGMAWMYGIDQENERVFLPRNVWFEQMSMDAYNMARNSNAANVGLSSNPIDQTIYGNSDTVQPNAVKKLLYICVGNTVADTSWVDVITQVEEGVKDIEEAKDEVVDAMKSAIGGTVPLGFIGSAMLGIDETLNLQRYLNGQIILQDQFKGFTKFLKRRVKLYPSLACTEEEWQTTITMSAFSQCGKFVIDDNAGTIRLPKVVNIQGLTDLSKLAEIVEAGLPNHKHHEFSDQNNGASWDNKTTQQLESGKQVTSMWYSGYAAYVLARTNSPANVGLSSNPIDQTIYGNSTTVQQEQIQYPYFIQVATGAETEDNIINEIELNNPFSLLDYKYSEYELNNLSWLRSNGQYNSKAVYPAVYDLLLKIYNGTETKAGVSVKLSTEEYTDYDFVLNTAEETFRFPIKVKLASGKAVVGNGITLGFTNGSINMGTSFNDYNGSYFIKLSPENYGQEIGLASGEQSGFKKTIGITTDPTKSGIETSDSDLYLYFYVGETVQNANLINAGRIEEKVADLIPNNSSLIAGYGMPVLANEIQIFISVNDVISIPSDGFFKPEIGPAGGFNMQPLNITTTSVVYSWTRGSAGYQEPWFPIPKGEYKITRADDAIAIYFYPLKGAI